jgi:3D (Asp-Asp-Asp) domain-containing protein
MVTAVFSVSGSLVTYAQANTNSLNSVEQLLKQKAQEKQSVNKDIDNVQKEMEALYTYISDNEKAMANTQQRIAETNQLIEKKKEEIVTLEDKILARKAVMKKRLLSLQHDDNLSLVIKVIIEAKSFDDFMQRASAVSALLGADKDILGAQEDDLKQIEKDKKEIDRQEKVIEEEQQKLAKQQQDLNQNLQKRQEKIAALQEKNNQINQQMAAAEQEKAGIEAQIKAAQEKILREQQAAAARAAASAATPGTPVAAPGKGEEMYVTATAYTPYDSGAITAAGYNIQANPNMKLIAVDPTVIPLGKKVWVEGYGVAIAGDTGGAIIGHKIDVLLPTKADALSWGRRTVKIIVLD